MAPTICVIIPTRDRPDYLQVALRSLAAQVARVGGEIIVVDDGPNQATRIVAEELGARYVAHELPCGANAARNTGIAATQAPLLAFVDDDVAAPDGWVEAILAGAAAHPEAGVLAGPIHARLEGSRIRMCGREGPPITTLDLGDIDGPAEFAWGANMTMRRSAIEACGLFDTAMDAYSLNNAAVPGDEQEWQRRFKTSGGKIHYIAAAGLDHRRSGADARLRSLTRAAFERGRNCRRYDVSRSEVAPLALELRVAIGCVWHTVRRLCANGIVMTAHSLGRIHETLDPTPTAGGADFLSGESGEASGRRATILLGATDALLDLRATASGRNRLLGRAAHSRPDSQQVLVIGIQRAKHAATMAAIEAELRCSRHVVTIALANGTGGRGKFANLNALLAENSLSGKDWLLVVDDDVVLPSEFLDRFLFLTQRFDLKLAQPAHRRLSHAAWRVTRRQGGSVVRETSFVEIGPVTAFHRDTFSTFLPFPDLWMGWGLDLHWAAVARQHGWPIGVVDATPIGHIAAPAGDAYSREAAVEEARSFLANRSYVTREEAQRTVVTHRKW